VAPPLGGCRQTQLETTGFPEPLGRTAPPRGAVPPGILCSLSNREKRQPPWGGSPSRTLCSHCVGPRRLSLFSVWRRALSIPGGTGPRPVQCYQPVARLKWGAGQGPAPRAPTSAHVQRGGSPLRANALRPVTKRNCIAVRGCGEQREVKTGPKDSELVSAGTIDEPAWKEAKSRPA